MSQQIICHEIIYNFSNNLFIKSYCFMISQKFILCHFILENLINFMSQQI